jgi:hypothetical protein
MDTRNTTIDDLSRLQLWQTFQPEACGLDFAVPELPGLHDLIRFANGRTDNADRVFDRNTRRRRIHETGDERQGALLLPGLALPCEMTCTRDSKVRARRMRNDQIPVALEHVQHIALKMRTRYLSWEQIARPCVMAQRQEGVANPAAVFTANQDPHDQTVTFATGD